MGIESKMKIFVCSKKEMRSQYYTNKNWYINYLHYKINYIIIYVLQKRGE